MMKFFLDYIYFFKVQCCAIQSISMYSSIYILLIILTFFCSYNLYVLVHYSAFSC